MNIPACIRPLAIVVLAAAVAAPAGAAPKKTDYDPTLPYFVNLNKVMTEYRKTPAFSKYQVKLREQFQVYSDEMEFLSQLRYCTPEERQEALAIKAKPGPSAKEKDRLQVLLKKADTVDNELSTLGQKQKPTDADTKRIQELSKLRTDAIKGLAKEEADRRDKLRDLEQDLTAQVEDNILKLIDQVAKDKKLTTVYSQSAILRGGNDLTDEVVKKIPSK